jgi:hypothetical protein
MAEQSCAQPDPRQAGRSETGREPAQNDELCGNGGNRKFEFIAKTCKRTRFDTDLDQGIQIKPPRPTIVSRYKLRALDRI